MTADATPTSVLIAPQHWNDIQQAVAAHNLGLVGEPSEPRGMMRVDIASIISLIQEKNALAPVLIQLLAYQVKQVSSLPSGPNPPEIIALVMAMIQEYEMLVQELRKLHCLAELSEMKEMERALAKVLDYSR